MNRPRPGRSLFLAYLCCSFVAVLLAAPLLSAVEPASAGASREGLTFGQADRNADGFVDAREARTVPGLTAAFGRADANADGRLDQVEFARALGRMTRK